MCVECLSEEVWFGYVYLCVVVRLVCAAVSVFLCVGGACGAFAMCVCVWCVWYLVCS